MDPHDPFLAGLTLPQAEAAKHDGITLVLAGRGTARTPALTSAVVWRIVQHGLPPNRVMAVACPGMAAASNRRTHPEHAAGLRDAEWAGLRGRP